MDLLPQNKGRLENLKQEGGENKMNIPLSEIDMKSFKQLSEEEPRTMAVDHSKTLTIHSMTGLSGILIGIMVASPTLLIPQHYIMDHPDAWYEFTLLSAFGWSGTLSVVMILNFSCWMDIKEVKSWKFFFSLYFVSAFATITLNLVIYIVWRIIFGFHPPMPYGGCSVRIITLHIMMATIWYRLPKIHRNNLTTRQRVKYYYFTELIFLGTFWVYLLLGKTFLSIPKRYQWILVS